MNEETKREKKEEGKKSGRKGKRRKEREEKESKEREMKGVSRPWGQEKKIDTASFHLIITFAPRATVL